MGMLLAAATVFLAIHFLISGTRLRDVLAGAIGERPYLGLFSLTSLAVIVWLCMAYNGAQTHGNNPVFYDLGHVRDAGIVIVLIAFLLGIPGLMLPNPTTVGGDAGTQAKARGVITITRHPFLWGVTIWSGFHLAANGDEASIILFGTFFVLALFGTLSIDAKRKRKMGDRWQAFAAETSDVPFAAALAGRTRIDWRGIFDWRLLLAFVLFIIILFGHHWAFKVSPFASGWRPY
jgi:uncharacterized membrane protein